MHCAPVHAADRARPLPGAMFDGIHAESFGTSYVKILKQNYTAAMSGYSTAKIVRAQFKLTTDKTMDGSVFSDGTLMCSVLDLISIANKATYDNHAHSKQVWWKFKKHPIHADELALLLKYDESEYRINPVMCIADLKRLLEILPDTRRMDILTQTKHRETLGATLKRYIDGDKSMVLFPGLKLDDRLALTLSNIEASVSGAAHAASSVKIKAPAVIETEIEDTSAISKFCLDPHADATDEQATDEELAWTLCNMEQQSRSNGASATSGKQAADTTSRIKSVHISGLLALNGAPSNANSPWSASSHDQVLDMCA
jgi:hypothetical protein